MDGGSRLHLQWDPADTPTRQAAAERSLKWKGEKSKVEGCWTPASVLVSILAVGAAGCGGPSDHPGGGGSASATIDSTRFEVSDVQLSLEVGDEGYFRIEGDDAAHPEEDCLPGLGGGLALYGGLPADVTSVADLAGRELPFEFSGDGDDFNLCFVGSNGLLGVEHGTVRFTAVDGNTVSFSFTGDFVRYDGEGSESPGTIAASGAGKAVVSHD